VERTRSWQGAHRELPLPAQTQRLSTRRQDAYARARVEQLGQLCTGCQHLFAVVQNQQYPTLAKRAEQPGEGRLGAFMHEPAGSSDGVHHPVRVANGAQVSKVHTIGVFGLDGRCNGECQPRLADTTWTGQCQQPRRVLEQHSARVADLLRATDQRARRNRQPHMGCVYRHSRA
jgi:hypothetical protein